MHVSLLTFLTIFCLCGSLAKICKPDYFWRLFKGEIPSDAFVAGEDAKGDPTYIAQVVPIDKYSWTIPVQFYRGENVINFNWITLKFESPAPPMKIDKFIHILCVDKNHTLQWIKLKDNWNEKIVNDCCLVEAGIGGNANQTDVSILYVGRKIYQGISYISRAYKSENPSSLFIFLRVNNSLNIPNDFEILTYNCNQIHL